TTTRRLIDRILARPERALADTRSLSVATVGNVAQIVNELENLRGRVDAARKAVAGWPSRRSASAREIELTRENIAVNEKSYASQARLITSGEAALVQKQTQLNGFRNLAERRLISSLELAAEEEKVRSAEAAATEARRRVEQLAVDISNQKIKLAELEGRMAAEPAVRDAAVRLAENAMRQSLSLLRQEGANMGIQLTEAESTLRATQARATMAENNVALSSVTTPVAGMVAEMKVSNTGELLAPGALVATIVPDGVPLVVEASVPNRDVGFVTPGISARIKVDAYPFQQFGTLAARVRTVVPGLGTDNSFTITLDLLESRIVASERALPLFPGLAVDAELLTARQRLITRLLAAGSTRRGGH
ncbi:MAG: HlyD family efflux transporter periplasmic adaptor subunit, partial [Vicinamibacterales bacterium]|nr:HlyD family efflux transporter periplasmic adaptor subunit [Vicinamibacterales bacterium]